jgi:hypothetical protein
VVAQILFNKVVKILAFDWIQVVRSKDMVKTPRRNHFPLAIHNPAKRLHIVPI